MPLLLQLVYSPGPSSKKLPSANFCLMDSRSFFCACEGRSAGRRQAGGEVPGTAARPVHKRAQHPGSLPDAHMDLYLLRSRGTHSHRGRAGTSSASSSPRGTLHSPLGNRPAGGFLTVAIKLSMALKMHSYVCVFGMKSGYKMIYKESPIDGHRNGCGSNWRVISENHRSRPKFTALPHRWLSVTDYAPVLATTS